MSEALIVFAPSRVRHRQLSKFQVSWQTRCYLLVNLLKLQELRVRVKTFLRRWEQTYSNSAD